MATEPKGLLFDMTRCAGCYSCVSACMEGHGLDASKAEEVKELSSKALTVIKQVEAGIVRDMCRHCVDPACASVCPVGALKKTELGPVTYDKSLCIGCRYCMVACDFNVPRYEWDQRIPGVKKCDMCFDQVSQGGTTRCADACPAEATVFGTRKELLADAHTRLADSPSDYFPHVYGEEEVGGTSVMFLAPKAVPELGYKTALGTKSLPKLTWAVIEKLPFVAVLGGAGLAGLSWIIHRRNEGMAQEKAEQAEAQKAQDLLQMEQADPLPPPVGGSRLGIWTMIFYFIMAAGLVSVVQRFLYGLGAVSNLSDAYPWGIWVSFNIQCGVGLAAGGFVITAAVHLLDVKRYKSLARPAILLAFLGYLGVSSALFIEIGIPWRIWHPLVWWNHHSVMWEVAWCVTLYSSVLFLEFSALPLERLGWTRALAVRKAVLPPLVLAGVVFSTLHQSSLGTMFLISPGKLHSLWYTPILPILYFFSAIAAGLATLVVASRFASRAFGRQFDTPTLKSIGRFMIPTLAFYGAMRIGDIAYRGLLPTLLVPSYEVLLFHVEFLLGVVLPLVLYSRPGFRNSIRGLYPISLLVMAGFCAHRNNMVITGFEGRQGGIYLPSWQETSITLMLIALAVAIFGFVARNCQVFPVETPAPGSAEAEGEEEVEMGPIPTA